MEDGITILIEKYIDKLKDSDYKPKKLENLEAHIDATVFMQDHKVMFDHVYWLCEDTKNKLDKDADSAMRWLGFIQSCLWIGGFYSMEEIEAQNRQIELLK